MKQKVIFVNQAFISKKVLPPSRVVLDSYLIKIFTSESSLWQALSVRTRFWGGAFEITRKPFEIRKFIYSFRSQLHTYLFSDFSQPKSNFTSLVKIYVFFSFQWLCNLLYNKIKKYIELNLSSQLHGIHLSP